MRPEPYRHLEDERVYDGLEQLGRRGRGARGVARPGSRSPGRSGTRRSVVVGPRRPEHLEPVREALSLDLSPAEQRGSRLALPLMAILVLTQTEVEQLLDMEGCMDAMAEVLEALARGELFQPLRMLAFPPGETSGMGLMPRTAAGRRPRTR